MIRDVKLKVYFVAIARYNENKQFLFFLKIFCKNKKITEYR